MQPLISKAGATALIAVSLGLAACGSSDDKDSSDSPLARTALVAKINAICATSQKEAAAIKAPDDISDSKAAAEYFGKAVPVAVGQNDEIAKLKPDAEAKADYDAFLALERQATKLLESLRDKAKANDASGIEDLKKLQPFSKQIAASATKLGADTCAT